MLQGRAVHRLFAWLFEPAEMSLVLKIYVA
jgi:hypothetical protein